MRDLIISYYSQYGTLVSEVAYATVDGPDQIAHLVRELKRAPGKSAVRITVDIALHPAR